jgi:hypothetical protein
VIVMQTELLHLSDKNIRGGGKRENIREVVRQQLDSVHRSRARDGKRMDGWGGG